MSDDLIARASTRIAASPDEVWRALTEPELVKRYFFGTTLRADWRPGGRITWSGEWQGKPYEDRGEVLEVVPRERLSHTHYSPLSGQPDVPGNYHTVVYELEPDAAGTRVTLEQDGNPTDEARRHSEQNWSMVLQGLKTMLEGKE